MNDSMQNILNTFYDSATKESEAAAARIRDAFRSLIQQIETPREEVMKLKARVEALEAEVADLKSKQLPR